MNYFEITIPIELSSSISEEEKKIVIQAIADKLGLMVIPLPSGGTVHLKFGAMQTER